MYIVPGAYLTHLLVLNSASFTNVISQDAWRQLVETLVCVIFTARSVL
jgi:hypothetical protein